MSKKLQDMDDIARDARMKKEAEKYNKKAQPYTSQDPGYER